MDKLVTLFYGGTVKENELGSFEFENMERMSLLFSARPTYSGIVDRVKERLRWASEHVDVRIDGLIDVGSSKGPRIKRSISISGQDEWETYMGVVTDSEDESEDDDGVGGGFDYGGCGFDDDDVPMEATGEEVTNPVAPEPPIAVAPPSIVCEASNRVNVQVHGDDDTYEAARAVDSDDDRPVCPLSPDSIEMLRAIFPGRDLLVSDFCDLSQSHRAVVDGGVDEAEIPPRLTSQPCMDHHRSISVG
ncbi:unnamed protein product [Urochloa decumbens]|uniref:Uncharacterized protein n=1 Tax=Urochloa decumbens TaxID=240449 RepID=A0ABC8X108_9POAL